MGICFVHFGEFIYVFFALFLSFFHRVYAYAAYLKETNSSSMTTCKEKHLTFSISPVERESV